MSIWDFPQLGGEGVTILRCIGVYIGAALCSETATTICGNYGSGIGVKVLGGWDLRVLYAISVMQMKI